jgi:hypothetical protein
MSRRRRKLRQLARARSRSAGNIERRRPKLWKRKLTACSDQCSQETVARQMQLFSSWSTRMHFQVAVPIRCHGCRHAQTQAPERRHTPAVEQTTAMALEQGGQSGT